MYQDTTTIIMPASIALLHVRLALENADSVSSNWTNLGPITQQLIRTWNTPLDVSSLKNVVAMINTPNVEEFINFLKKHQIEYNQAKLEAVPIPRIFVAARSSVREHWRRLDDDVQKATCNVNDTTIIQLCKDTGGLFVKDGFDNRVMQLRIGRVTLCLTDLRTARGTFDKLVIDHATGHSRPFNSEKEVEFPEIRCIIGSNAMAEICNAQNYTTRIITAMGSGVLDVTKDGILYDYQSKVYAIQKCRSIEFNLMEPVRMYEIDADGNVHANLLVELMYDAIPVLATIFVKK